MSWFTYVLAFGSWIMSFVRTPGHQTSVQIEAYFSAVGIRVAWGAPDNPDKIEPVWQLGPIGELHVLEFPTSSAVWRWWRDRVTENPEAGDSDPFYSQVQNRPGWLREALRKNMSRVAGG